MRLYINSNNEQIGPIKDDEVTTGLASGRFNPTDLGIREGESDCRPLDDLFPNQPNIEVKKAWLRQDRRLGTSTFRVPLDSDRRLFRMEQSVRVE